MYFGASKYQSKKFRSSSEALGNVRDIAHPICRAKMTKCKKNTMFRYFKRPSNADQAANKRPKLDEQTSEPLDEDISAESAVDGQKSPLNDKSASSSSIESA